MNIFFTCALATIALQDISNPEHLDKIVEIRGFLHQMPNDEWVISTLPNARSCCTGTRHQRVVVRGEFEAPNKCRAVTVKGKLIQKEDHFELICN
jgi:hypothetical protein